MRSQNDRQTRSVMHIRWSSSHTSYNDAADEWRHLCGCGFSFGRVERKPHIFLSANCTPNETTGPPTNSNTTTPTNPYTIQQPQQRQQRQQQLQQQPEPRYAPLLTSVTGERGDASCHGFWERGRNTIFGIRITDTEAPSYPNQDFTKVLAAQEKEKKRKYLAPLHAQRKDFTPMIYSVDGIAGREAKSAEKRIVSALAGKWKKEYSEMVFYVRVRMALAVVKANSLLIRGSRERQRPRRPIINNRAAMYDCRCWHDG